jgi:hypothetical protein
MDVKVEIVYKDEYDTEFRGTSESKELDDDIFEKHLPVIIDHFRRALIAAGFEPGQVADFWPEAVTTEQ